MGRRVGERVDGDGVRVGEALSVGLGEGPKE